MGLLGEVMTAYFPVLSNRDTSDTIERKNQSDELNENLLYFIRLIKK